MLEEQWRASLTSSRRLGTTLKLFRLRDWQSFLPGYAPLPPQLVRYISWYGLGQRILNAGRAVICKMVGYARRTWIRDVMSKHLGIASYVVVWKLSATLGVIEHVTLMESSPNCERYIDGTLRRVSGILN
jgi:hypothetical protein